MSQCSKLRNISLRRAVTAYLRGFCLNGSHLLCSSSAFPRKVGHSTQHSLHAPNQLVEPQPTRVRFDSSMQLSTYDLAKGALLRQGVRDGVPAHIAASSVAAVFAITVMQVCTACCLPAVPAFRTYNAPCVGFAKTGSSATWSSWALSSQLQVLPDIRR